MKPIQLFCLPYAGGSPDFFDGLKPYLDETITLCALEYAGHGKRLKEEAYADFAALARDMAQRINEQLKPETELMLFGYSMGSIGVYEMLADGLLDRQPVHVFLASHEAPDGHWDSKRYLDMSDEDFLEAMKQFGGFDNVKPEMLRNRFFRRMYFQPIREDYRLLGNYPANHRWRFSMNTTMFYSEQDIPAELIHGWDSFFAGQSEYIQLGDNHFFLKTCAKQTAAAINRAVAVASANSTTSPR